MRPLRRLILVGNKLQPENRYIDNKSQKFARIVRECLIDANKIPLYPGPDIMKNAKAGQFFYELKELAEQIPGKADEFIKFYYDMVANADWPYNLDFAKQWIKKINEGIRGVVDYKTLSTLRKYKLAEDSQMEKIADELFYKESKPLTPRQEQAIAQMKTKLDTDDYVVSDSDSSGIRTVTFNPHSGRAKVVYHLDRNGKWTQE